MEGGALLYTTISEGLAIVRYGASPLLRAAKAWSLDGWLVDADSPGVLCSAYTVQELLSAKTERQLEVELTGNSRYDLAMTMSRLLSEMRRKHPMPFRVWQHDHYLSSSRRSVLQFMVGQSGEVRLFRLAGRVYEEVEPSRGAEVERSTGYDDVHGVPIFQNDAVTMDGGMFRVGWCANGWQLLPIDGDESAGVDLASERGRVRVAGPARTDRQLLKKVAGLMDAQEKFAVAAWR